MPPHTQDSAPSQARFYYFADFELDVADEALRRTGENLNISHRMFQVLLLLLEHQGETVNKEDFFEKVWDGNFVEDNNLTVTVTGLRKILGDDAKQARFIKNIPRKGYRFVADVTSGYEPARNKPNDSLSSGNSTDISRFKSSETDPGHSNRSTRFWHRRATKLTVSVLSIAAFAILTFAVVRQRPIWLSSAHSSGRIDSIAVLPFEDMTRERGYIVDGLTDGLIADLSRSRDLRVIDRNSTYQYKTLANDPASAGGELQVRSVVTGTLQQDGDVFVITVELLDVQSNTQVWRQQYRRGASEIFDTQREISTTILQNVEAERSGSNAVVYRKRPTEDAEAYDLYLKGRYYWNKRTDEDILRSVQLFKSAIDRDPTFAQAYVGLGNAYTLGDFGGMSADERVQLSRGAIQKALEIDDSLGEAYAALAINKCYHDWDLAAAESDYRRAIDLNPNDATAHHWYAELLAMQGRFDESFSEYDRAMSLDPLSLPIRTDRALTYYYERDYDAAITALNKVGDMNPEYERTYQFLQWACREKGMFKEAADAIQNQIDLQSRQGARSAADQGRYKKYVRELQDGAAKAGADGFWKVQLETKIDPTPYYTAVAYAKLGNADKAFEYLEKAAAAHYSGMVWLKVTPELDSLRSDPRFNDLLRRVGL